MNADDLKAWSWKQIISQRGLVGTGQKSSDDEVSKLMILSSERDFFWKISVWVPYLCVGECLYSIHGTVIISITVPLVKEFITAMEVMIFEPAFHKQ